MTATFTEQIEIADLDKLPDEYRDILCHQMLANGEGELSAGDTYVNAFYPLAPNADERYKCLEFGMEEVDHYRRFARLLDQLGVDTSHMVGQEVADRRYFPAESMTTRFESWEERAAFSFLCELEGHFQIKEMTTSTYQPLVTEAHAILKEEAGHFAHGKKLMKAAATDPAAKSRAQLALNRFYPMALDMFGKSDSSRGRRAVHWGLRQHDNGELRELYQVEIQKHIESLGYDMPDYDRSVRRFT
jgi:ring-1,2-phenylacetyl-CoA epoxidase subunit PaaA